MNIQRPAYNMTPPLQFQIFGKELQRTCWTTRKIIRWSPFFRWQITKKSSLIFKQIWYSTSTTAAVIRNHYPESTENNVKLISWSYYCTSDHTTFYQIGHKKFNLPQHNLSSYVFYIQLHYNFHALVQCLPNFLFAAEPIK